MTEIERQQKIRALRDRYHELQRQQDEVTAAVADLEGEPARAAYFRACAAGASYAETRLLYIAMQAATHIKHGTTVEDSRPVLEAGEIRAEVERMRTERSGS